MEKCSAYKCKNYQSKWSTITFHTFPFRDPDLLNKWIGAMHLKNWFPKKTSRLCSDHFSPDAYMLRPGAQCKWLRDNAVPSIFSFPESVQPPNKKTNRPTLCSSKILPRCNIPATSTLSPSNEDIVAQEQMPVGLQDQPGYPPRNTHETLCSSMILQRYNYEAKAPSLLCNENIVGDELMNVVPQIIMQKRETKSTQTVALVESPTRATLRKNIKNLQAKLKRRDQKILTMSQLLKSLQNRTPQTLYDILKRDYEGFPLHLLLENKTSDNQKTRRRYSDATRKFALTVYFYSPRTYEYLRTVFILPHSSMISRWISSVDGDPGILNDVLRFLEVNVKMMPHLQNVALIMDAMSIRKQITFSRRKQKMVGYVDFGGWNDGASGETAATEALVFQIVSYKNKFKCPVAYFLTNKLSADVQAQLINIILSRLYEVGVTVHSVTCDGTSTNFATFKKLGCHFEELKTSFPHPTAPNLVVYAVIDDCHCLKNARNALAAVKVMQSEEGEIKWDYIVKLNELQESLELKFANKLSNMHIDFKNKIMNVKLAVQTLSSGVADALEFLSKVDSNFKEAEATVSFIRHCDRIFDILNSRTKFGKGFKRPITLSNYTSTSEVCKETIDYFSQLRIEGVNILKHPRRAFALGLIITILSVLGLSHRLLKDVPDFLEFFLTYKISQDQIELFFSLLRSRFGWNNNPNAEQLAAAMRSILMHNAVVPSTRSNCMIMDSVTSNPIVEFRSCRRTITQQHRIVSEPEPETESSSYYKDNVLYYIAGYVVRTLLAKITCNECLTLIRPINQEKSDCALGGSPTNFTQYVNRGGLLFVADWVFQVTKFTRSQVKLSVIKGGQNLEKRIVVEVNKHFTLSHKLQLNHSVTEEGAAELHTTQLIKEIASIVCRLFLNVHAKKQTQLINGNKTSRRQLYNKAVLHNNE